MKHICNSCKSMFNDPYHTGHITTSESKLVRIITLCCPFCTSTNVELTEHGKLLINRKAKINKLESEKD